MARYRMSDGMVVDTTKASQEWGERKRFDGRNFGSVATGDQWAHECLFRSRRGRYYIESWSDWQGSRSSAEWISNEEAVRWLLLNDHDIPADLAQIVDSFID